MTSDDPTHRPGRATAWLRPLVARDGGPTRAEVGSLDDFEGALSRLLVTYPIGSDIEPSVRSRRLLEIRRQLAVRDVARPALSPPARAFVGTSMTQTLRQFICGYHDLDLRDTTGLGHGRLIATHATSAAKERWLSKLHAGALAGIAVTESHGGSRPLGNATKARICPDGTRCVSGTKTWISRLREAAVFCVFFTDREGLSAGLVEADAGGLIRRPVEPHGLAGWSWGELRLDDVRMDAAHLLGAPGRGMTLLREHFTHYRPLVAATALGASARAHDIVSADLRDRRAKGIITAVRDHGLIVVGRAFAQINAALLATLTAQQMSDDADGQAELWGWTTKALSVDIAYTTASELALLVGASGFAKASPLLKIRRDLNGLLYADGIHDSLYRAAGRLLIGRAPDASLRHPRRGGEDRMAGM